MACEKKANIKRNLVHLKGFIDFKAIYYREI